MRVIICGSRYWDDAARIESVIEALTNLDPDLTVIEGGALGADRLARDVARNWGLEVEEYPAIWSHYGKAAGPKRNQQMLDSGVDLVIAFHHDLASSKGTADMVRRAKKLGVPVRLES